MTYLTANSCFLTDLYVTGCHWWCSIWGPFFSPKTPTSPDRSEEVLLGIVGNAQNGGRNKWKKNRHHIDKKHKIFEWILLKWQHHSLNLSSNETNLCVSKCFCWGLVPLWHKPWPLKSLRWAFPAAWLMKNTCFFHVCRWWRSRHSIIWYGEPPINMLFVFFFKFSLTLHDRQPEKVLW